MRHLRLLHHQACTGGTVMARCIAALPGVALLSEISAAGPGTTGFAPLAVLAQLIGNSPALRPSPGRLAALLGRDLQEAHDLAAAHGRALVVRDHSHSDWMWRNSPRHASFDAIAPMFETVSAILTVRHPTASYHSLVENDWAKGVDGYADYCARYLGFVATMHDTPRFQYEAFCAAPAETLAAMAVALTLPYDAAALENWPEIRLSGNSGRARTATVIRPLAFTAWTPELDREVSSLADHRELCTRLGYPADLRAYAEAQNRLAVRHDPSDAQAAAMLAAIARTRRPAVPATRPAPGRKPAAAPRRRGLPQTS